MVTDALQRGDAKTARGLMSRRGLAMLTNSIGKELADDVWPTLQRDATEALGRLGSGVDAEAGVAFDQLDAVERSFTVGANLADMLLERGVHS